MPIRLPPVDTFEQHGQLRRGKEHLTLPARGPGKTSALKAF